MLLVKVNKGKVRVIKVPFVQCVAVGLVGLMMGGEARGRIYAGFMKVERLRRRKRQAKI